MKYKDEKLKFNQILLLYTCFLFIKNDNENKINIFFVQLLNRRMSYSYQ